MNKEAFFLFLILLLGLVLCSFLGGNCNREGLINNNIIYKGPYGTVAVIMTNSNGKKYLHVSNPNNSHVAIFKQSSTSSDTFTDEYGFTAKLSKNDIVFTSPNNITITFTSSNSSSNNNYDNYNHYHGTSSQLINGTTYFGPHGGSVVIVQNKIGKYILVVKLHTNSKPMFFNTSSNSNDYDNYKNKYRTNYNRNHSSFIKFYGPSGYSAEVIKTPNGGIHGIRVITPNSNNIFTINGVYYDPESITSTQYYGSTGYPIQTGSYNLSYQKPNNDYYNSYQGSYGGSAGTINEKQSSNKKSANGYGNNYYSAFPQGVSKNEIPTGKEDLYILKSEIVPPVCPVCPTSTACPRQEKCPPCPACARCPEPAFECKKVPNYNAINNEFLPQPILNNFSQFGM
jgi:hypothetical protein